MIETLPVDPMPILLQQMRVQHANISPGTLASQIVEPPRAGAWMCDIVLPVVSVEASALMRAWVARRRGMSVPFLVGDTCHLLPLGTARGNGSSVAGTEGATVVTATLTGTLKAGDYFSCNDRLYTLEEDSSGGQLKIWPPLRDTGGPMVFESPKGKFRFATPNEGREQLGQGAVMVNISAVEAL